MRDMTTDAAAAVSSPVVRPVVLVDMDFESGHVRVHSGVGSLVHEGFNYQGLGTLGKISSLAEQAEIQASSLSFTLSGVDPDRIYTALAEHYQGRSVVLYLALLNEELQLVIEPVVLWQGRMDVMSITLGEIAEITLTANNPLADWDRSRVRRYNNEDQQSIYPDDKGFEFVEQSVNQQILWGADPANVQTS